MTRHDEHVDLVGLVGSQLSNAEVAAAHAHLQDCNECRQELSEVVAGHALLSRSAATLTAGPAPRRARTTPVEEPLPPMQRPSRAHRARKPVVAALAAVALVAVFFGVSNALDQDQPAPPQAQERSATLEPVEGDGAGTVSMTSRPGEPEHMVIKTSGLPVPETGQFYYAWLLDPATNKMLPLGQVWPDGSTSFDLDAALIAAYSAIDVSLEEDDGDPEHSPVSVLRATYA